MVLFLSESEQNSRGGREGGGANFVSVPSRLHGSTWTNGSSKHRGEDSNKPLIEEFRDMLMSSARKPGRDSHVFAVYVKQS